MSRRSCCGCSALLVFVLIGGLILDVVCLDSTILKRLFPPDPIPPLIADCTNRSSHSAWYMQGEVNTKTGRPLFRETVIAWDYRTKGLLDAAILYGRSGYEARSNLSREERQAQRCTFLYLTKLTRTKPDTSSTWVYSHGAGVAGAPRRTLMDIAVIQWPEKTAVGLFKLECYPDTPGEGPHDLTSLARDEIAAWIEGRPSDADVILRQAKESARAQEEFKRKMTPGFTYPVPWQQW